MCTTNDMLDCVFLNLNNKEWIDTSKIATDSQSDLPLPVGEVQEGENRGAAGTRAEFSVRAVIWQVAVAGWLSWRGTGGGAVSIWIWWTEKNMKNRGVIRCVVCITERKHTSLMEVGMIASI